MKAKMACNEMYSVQKLKYVNVVKQNVNINISISKCIFLTNALVKLQFLFTNGKVPELFLFIGSDHGIPYIGSHALL